MTSDFYKRPLFLLLVLYALVLVFFLPLPKAQRQDIVNLSAPEPKEITLKISSYPALKKDRETFFADIISVDGLAVKSRSYVVCKDCTALQRGETLTLKGIIEPVLSFGNYGSFDWQQYLARRRVFSTVNTKAGGIISVLPAAEPLRFLGAVRSSILKVFRENLSPRSAVVLGGITLGEKGSVDKELYTAFQDSGAIHLLVASGGNVGFVTLIIYFLCSIFFSGRYIPAFAALSAALLYTLIAGADAPLLRAYLMTFCATAGFLLGRKSGVLQGLVISALLILICAPQSIFDAGFQMSFLAVLFIVWFSCNFNFVRKWPPVAAWSGGLFFISLSAQLALLPVFTNAFHRVSFAAVISNIVLVPLSGILMGGGFLLWICSALPFDFLFKVLVFITEKLLYVFNFFVEAFAAVPVAGLEVSSWSFWYIAAYYGAMFVLFNFPVFLKKKLFVICGLSLAAILFLCGLFIKPDLTYLLKGRYARTLFVRQSGKIKLIGGGIDSKTAKDAVLQSGSKTIDCLFINSVYKSSAYVFKDLQSIKIKRIYLPDADLPQSTQELLAPYKAEVIPMKAGQSYCGIQAQIPWYGEGNPAAPKEKYKSLSLVYGGYDFSADMKSYKKAGELFLYN